MANWATVVSRAVRTLALGSTETLTDRDLLNQFSTHSDQTAFAVLVRRHGPMVQGVCRRLLPSPADAEDATQAVFVLLAQKASKINWQSSISNWLYTVARKIAGNARRSALRRERREQEISRSEVASPLEEMSGRELLGILDEELERLPSHYREPLILCYLQGLSRDEASKQLGVPEATLKSQLERGRKKLAQALEKRGCSLTAVLLLVTSGSASISRAMTDSMLWAISGQASAKVASLVQSAAIPSGIGAFPTLVALAIGALLIGIGLLTRSPSPVQTPKIEPAKKSEIVLEEKRETEAEGFRLGVSRFQAEQRIDDARYRPDGKQIVGIAGTEIHVWDTTSGELLKRLETKLEPLEDPLDSRRMRLYFAVHPKHPWVVCGGEREDKGELQLWDYQSGKRLHTAETQSARNSWYAWTPDGKLLVERANYGSPEKPIWKLVVRDEKLEQKQIHQLDSGPPDYGTASGLMHDGKRMIHWLPKSMPTVYDLETGKPSLQFDAKFDIPSDLAVSPDGKTLVATSTNEMVLFNAETGAKIHDLKVIRDGWEKPRPLFSADSKIVYLWDHQPMAFKVETGERLWKAVSPTFYFVTLKMRDLSPDGKTILTSASGRLVFLDARTGKEIPKTESPVKASNVTWSPDGKVIFTRNESRGAERTWTAWNREGKRLYHLLPPDFATNDMWKFAPNLFFINGGKEVVACLVKNNSHETSAFKQFLVFDVASGKFVRHLGEELGEEFRWMVPIALDEKGEQVTLQAYAISGFEDPKYPTVVWNFAEKKKVKEWVCTGGRFDAIGRYGPFNPFVKRTSAIITPTGLNERQPAKIRLHSLSEGTLKHEFSVEFTDVELDRIAGRFLFSTGYNHEYVTVGKRDEYRAKAPFAYDLWELPTGEKLRILSLEKYQTVAFSPRGDVVFRLVDGAVELYEPLVLKKSLLTIREKQKIEKIDFSNDGKSVGFGLSDGTIAIHPLEPWLKQAESELRKQLSADLAPLGNQLSQEPEKAFAAVRLLSLGSESTVNLLAKQIAAKKPLAEESVEKWIRGLEAEEFLTRERAAKELRNHGQQVEKALRQALKGNLSSDAARRIEELLKAIEKRELSPEMKHEIRAVEILKLIATPEAKALLKQWANGAPDTVLTRAASEAIRE